MSREEFVHALARCFPMLWQVHPFREGNTRTVVMMMTFFVEHHGYYMDQELMAASAGYVRDSFVMASLDQYSEYEHLERILMDAVCETPLSTIRKRWMSRKKNETKNIKSIRRKNTNHSRITNERTKRV